MKPNQLHLIKKTEKKLDLIEELNTVAETRIRELEKKIEGLESEVKKILYAIGK